MFPGPNRHPTTLSVLRPQEATLISHDADGYDHVPCIYTDVQIQGWKKVTDAVRIKGSFLNFGHWAVPPIQVCILGKQDPPSPYVSAFSFALTEAEIQEYIAVYASAASNAVNGAGFDGYV